jgi:type IV secretion system protein VirB3
MIRAEDDKPLLTPLVIGLTRAPTLWGVPYMAIVVVIGLTIVAWLVTNTFWSLATAPFSYLALFALCRWDARALDVIQVATRRTPRIPNRTFWGANSYGP